MIHKYWVLGSQFFFNVDHRNSRCSSFHAWKLSLLSKDSKGIFNDCRIATHAGRRLGKWNSNGKISCKNLTLQLEKKTMQHYWVIELRNVHHITINKNSKQQFLLMLASKLLVMTKKTTSNYIISQLNQSAKQAIRIDNFKWQHKNSTK